MRLTIVRIVPLLSIVALSTLTAFTRQKWAKPPGFFTWIFGYIYINLWDAITLPHPSSTVVELIRRWAWITDEWLHLTEYFRLNYLCMPWYEVMFVSKISPLCLHDFCVEITVLVSTWIEFQRHAYPRVELVHRSALTMDLLPDT